MGKIQHRLYHCIVCDEEKSRRKFDARGRSRHICKDCYALPAEVRSEALRIDRLFWLIPKYPKSRDDWAIFEQYAAQYKDKESGQLAQSYLEENSSHYRSNIAAKKRKTDRINNIKNKKEMKELLEKIEVAIVTFTKDATAQVESGNKAAGTRARKASLELANLMKEFRKVSIEASKE